jgi:hypothetical protein
MPTLSIVLFGIMNDNGHPLWLVLGVISFFPVAATVEIIGALLSRRVRAYIMRHPIAHFLWFACALFMLLLLIPVPSKPRHRQGGGTHQAVPNLGALLNISPSVGSRVAGKSVG